MATRNISDSPARWQAALDRAIANGIQVRQLASTGQWIATSGSDATVAHELGVTGGIAHECDCLAAQHGDPICQHRAAYYRLIGALAPLPVAAPAPRRCSSCTGGRIEEWGVSGVIGCQPCGICGGSGFVTEPAAALAA